MDFDWKKKKKRRRRRRKERVSVFPYFGDMDDLKRENLVGKNTSLVFKYFI